MQGLEISQKFFEQYGVPMLDSGFSEHKGRIAAGAVGQGSEFLGFDDEISRDHDFCAGFCLWLSREDEEKIGFSLMRAYNRLPKEFEGVKMQEKSSYASNKYGVFIIDDFYESLIGRKAAPKTNEEWLYMPEYALANAVSGKVFYDGSGEFSAVRKSLEEDMPCDVRLKKLAAHLAFMAQSGQYNFSRCIAHGETAAAQLALFEFANHAVYTIFALNKKYTPFYKWRFRALKALPMLSDKASALEELITTPNEPLIAKHKADMIEEICADIISVLTNQGLTSSKSDFLEQHALSVTAKITDRTLKAMHLMDGIE